MMCGVGPRSRDWKVGCVRCRPSAESRSADFPEVFDGSPAGVWRGRRHRSRQRRHRPPPRRRLLVRDGWGSSAARGAQEKRGTQSGQTESARSGALDRWMRPTEMGASVQRLHLQHRSAVDCPESPALDRDGCRGAWAFVLGRDICRSGRGKAGGRKLHERLLGKSSGHRYPDRMAHGRSEANEIEQCPIRAVRPTERQEVRIPFL